MVVAEKPVIIAQSVDWDKEWLKCHLSFLYFMITYGHIKDAALGVVPFTAYPHLLMSAKVIQDHSLVIALKSRQIGWTWLMAHLAVWTALFHQGAKVIILSKSEEAANETLAYARFIWTKLPEALRPPPGRDQSSLLVFPSIDSQIRTCSSTETAGIGFGDASLVIADEFDFHKYAEQNYAEIKPMIDAGGGRKMVIGSAPNVLEPNSKFKELFRQARSGQNNFYPIFIPYNVMPYRDEVWYESERKNYDPLEFLTRYPKTEQEALTSAKDLCRFDVPSLQELINDAKSWRPIEERHNGIVKIYKRPSAGTKKYVFVIDPSRGGGDPSVGLILDWKTLEEVAEFCGKISVDEQARIGWELYQEYDSPYTAVERNADGERLIEKLVGFGVKNFYYDPNDKKKEKPGWWTSGKSRPVMIGELADSISRKEVRLHNAAALEQFFYFVRTDRKPEGEATKGSNDDYVMATAMALQLHKTMPSGVGITVSHGTYRG